jgi:hypothetical protein
LEEQRSGGEELGFTAMSSPRGSQEGGEMREEDF